MQSVQLYKLSPATLADLSHFCFSLWRSDVFIAKCLVSLKEAFSGLLGLICNQTKKEKKHSLSPSLHKYFVSAGSVYTVADSEELKMLMKEKWELCNVCRVPHDCLQPATQVLFPARVTCKVLHLSLDVQH